MWKSRNDVVAEITKNVARCDGAEEYSDQAADYKNYCQEIKQMTTKRIDSKDCNLLVFDSKEWVL